MDKVLVLTKVGSHQFRANECNDREQAFEHHPELKNLFEQNHFLAQEVLEGSNYLPKFPLFRIKDEGAELIRFFQAEQGDRLAEPIFWEEIA